MALFYFHFTDGTGRSADDVGIEFVSAEAAYLEAVAAARNMWPDLLMSRRDPMRCAFEIADENDKLLFRLDFRELLEHCGSPPPTRPAHPSIWVDRVDAMQRRVSEARREFAMALRETRATLKQSHALLNQLRQMEKAGGRQS